MENRLQAFQIHGCDRPVVIWGTKEASWISYRLLRKLHIEAAAIGDNNAQMHGKTLYDIPILPAQEIMELYPNAVIVVSSFFCDVSDSIIKQLTLMNKGFYFCRFEQIEFLYETEYLRRCIQDKSRLFEVIHNITQDEEHKWKKNVNKRVMSEYRYTVHNSEALDLKEELQNLYGIKKLLLIVNSYNKQNAVNLVKELSQYGSIGHFILVLEKESVWNADWLKCIADKIFYIICNGELEETARRNLEEFGVTVQTAKLLDEIFFPQKLDCNIKLTQKKVINSVLQFVHGENSAGRAGIPEDERPVFIVQLFNGLANQSFMYLFGRYLEEESGKKVIFDDTVLCLDVLDEEENIRRIQGWNKGWCREKIEEFVAETRRKNSFYHYKRAELAEVFDIQVCLLSDYFDESTWMKYLRKAKEELSHKYVQSFPLGQILTADGIDVTVIRDCIMPDEMIAVNHCWCADTYVLDMPWENDTITDFLFHSERNLYCIGIWATGKAEDCYFHNRRWVQKQLPFRLGNLSGRNQKYIRQIQESDGVMVHIRRGDFAYFDVYGSTEYFRKAIEAAEALSEYKSKKYFVFSDDLEWCRHHKELLGFDKVKDRLSFVEGNEGADSYIDLFLMSLGKILIPAPGSSFSYLAMLLSGTIRKWIDIPRYLYSIQQGTCSEVEFVYVEN